MPNQKTEKTERIRKRLEEIKSASLAAARPAAEEIEMADVPLTESDVTPAAAKPAAAKAEVGDTEEFVLDSAAKFIWHLDGEHLTGQYRLNDNTMTISDPVVGYTASVPISLPLAVSGIKGIGRLINVESGVLPKISPVIKLKNGQFVANMAFPLSLPRIMWRMANRKIVWAVVQYVPTKSEWRVLRLRSTPLQTVYEAGEILRVVIGESAYTKLKEAVELLATPL
ncbi:MAG: hypothetical protein RXO32_11275 [Thermoproteus sp.]